MAIYHKYINIMDWLLRNSAIQNTTNVRQMSCLYIINNLKIYSQNHKHPLYTLSKVTKDKIYVYYLTKGVILMLVH